jgi:uncharacterized protein involved in type VI secretion and phage assembly
METNVNTEFSPSEQKVRFYGKYRGIVTKNNDPKNLGRIRAKVPDVLDDVETGWALPCLPYSGNGSGLYVVPEPDAGVWIEFEAGDVSHPLWSGCWWGSGQLPKSESGTGATPPLKIIRSEKGLMITMDDDSQTVTLSDENGSNLITIKVQEGQITLKSTTKAVVEAPKIELVENAAHPVVFGDNLVNYLNLVKQLYDQHLHPGQLCLGIFPIVPDKPVIPQPPPEPAMMLSTRVSSG